MEFFESASEIATVEQDDGGRDEVEGRSSRLLVLQSAIAKATEPVEGDGPREAVAGLALVELGGDERAQFGVLIPAQGEERAFDAADLAQGGGE